MSNGWIAVDLDGTLAEYHGWPSDGSIGKPIPAMVERVKTWLAEGKDVRIFTARIWPIWTMDYDPTKDPRSQDAVKQLWRIQEWLKIHIGRTMEVTCIKDYRMIELWDDLAVQVVPNTGQPIAP